MDRYFKIQHFVHPEHPLILIELKDSKTRGLIEAQKNINREKLRSDRLRQGRRSVVDVSISCVLCRNEMLDTSYSCIDCDIHLHKLCAKLPKEMMHPSHHEHPLTLTYRHGSFGCDICPKESGSEYSSELINVFSYYCRSCDFDAEVKCASKREAINHKGHPHPLYPVLRTALFKCDGCGTKHSDAAGGVSYMCDTCDFWVHEDCATLPATIKYRHHVHPLSLVIYRPSIYFWGNCLCCSICKEDILEQWNQKWYYECDGCEHKVHTICLATTLIVERNKTYEVDADIDLTKLFRLPESFQYEDLVAQMIKHMTIHYGGENTALSKVEGPLISHFSHKHQLTLIHNDMPSINKREDLLCNACVLPLSTPQVYYSCTECNNYALHEWCAKLPIVLLQHPAHPHQLILQGPDHENFGATDCPACGFYSNGFSYRCRRRDTAACRRFAMDIKCLLPPAILHKAHEHPLKLVKNCINEGCVACRFKNSKLAYGCVSCCFYLHHDCAIKPTTIVHRYDKHHPFISTGVVPVGKRADDDEYVCEFCEEDIDHKWWFHHCLHCDVSACSECIFPKYGGRSHLNAHLTYSSPAHRHPLSHVKLDRTNKNSLCALCSRPIRSYHGHALHCAQCKVMFHTLDCSFWKSKTFPLVLQEGPSCH